MTREDKVFRHIDRNGQGIEIGPSHSPLAPKRRGFNVHIIDHMSRDELVAKYQEHRVDLANIEEVDFVWKGESFEELTGKPRHYDWIIASHVIEHTPDLIGFLNSCDAILKEDGILSLVIPDKRYCFDHYRPITGISSILDSHLQGHRIHTAGTVAEYFLNVVSRSGNIAWDANANGEYAFIHTPENALQGIRTVLNDKKYLDVHAWCFVPHSLRLLIHDLFSLGFIPLQEVDYFPTDGNEFYMTLGRKGQGTGKSRLELLDAIEEEITRDVSARPGEAAMTKYQRFMKRLARRLS